MASAMSSNDDLCGNAANEGSLFTPPSGYRRNGKPSPRCTSTGSLRTAPSVPTPNVILIDVTASSADKEPFSNGVRGRPSCFTGTSASSPAGTAAADCAGGVAFASNDGFTFATYKTPAPRAPPNRRPMKSLPHPEAGLGEDAGSSEKPSLMAFSGFESA